MSHENDDHRQNSSPDSDNEHQTPGRYRNDETSKTLFKDHSHETYNGHKNNHQSESPYISHDENDDQPSMNDHSRSSFHINNPSNDGPFDQNVHSLSLEHEDEHLNTNRSSSHDKFDISKDLAHLNSDQRHSPIDKTKSKSHIHHPACAFHSDHKWLDLQLKDGHTDTSKTPQELENQMEDPPGHLDEHILDKIQGSIFGLALGDALGARVEFRPYEYMKNNPVTKLEGGGTWGLEAGQFTDDTSMALCLANSLIARRDFIPYDQLVRYKWWYRKGYMSSTGLCFDIGAATSQAIHEFEKRQNEFSEQHNIPLEQLDNLSDLSLLEEFEVYCSEDEVAGNGALMRLTPVPLFFYRNRFLAVEFSGRSGEITHGDKKAYDACRYYGALIVAALLGYTKEEILARNFYSAHRHWFGDEPLEKDIQEIAEGSFKDAKGHDGNIAGKGYIVKALEAALWAFWSDEKSFKTGVLKAVNLGDDTDTTAAIYGQLAGAFYGYKELPKEWINQVFAHGYLEKISKWIVYEGERWEQHRVVSARKHK
ncbi:unnamed protein product [Adineta ricciae]|uniref:ADP-ribosylglycohydrolase n=2 Tax=Adineta ricciae TaxID=249248 RepID=A0A815QK00_ADIRI|nr:unnamed protein product [Adineta ricciae]